MNNINDKTFLNTMQEAYDNSLNASKVKEYIPEAMIFIKVLLQDDGLIMIRHKIEAMEIDARLKFKTVKLETLKFLEEHLLLILEHIQKFPELFFIKKNYVQIKIKYNPESIILIHELRLLLIESIYHLKYHRYDNTNAKTNVFLEQFVKFSPTYEIIEYKFLPIFMQYDQALLKFEEAFNEGLIAAYNHLKSFYSLEANNFNDKDYNPSINIKLFKSYIQCIWLFIKSHYQTIANDSYYNGNIHALCYKSYIMRMQFKSLRHQASKTLFLKGKPRTKAVPFGDIYDIVTSKKSCAIWSAYSNKVWDDLSIEEQNEVIKDIRDALDQTNIRASKELHLPLDYDYIVIKNNTAIINNMPIFNQNSD